MLARYLKDRKLCRASDREAHLLLSATAGGAVIGHLYGVDDPHPTRPTRTTSGGTSTSPRFTQWSSASPLAGVRSHNVLASSPRAAAVGLHGRLFLAHCRPRSGRHGDSQVHPLRWNATQRRAFRAVHQSRSTDVLPGDVAPVFFSICRSPGNRRLDLDSANTLLKMSCDYSFHCSAESN